MLPLHAPSSKIYIITYLIRVNSIYYYSRDKFSSAIINATTSKTNLKMQIDERNRGKKNLVDIVIFLNICINEMQNVNSVDLETQIVKIL